LSTLNFLAIRLHIKTFSFVLQTTLTDVSFQHDLHMVRADVICNVTTYSKINKLSKEDQILI